MIRFRLTPTSSDKLSPRTRNRKGGGGKKSQSGYDHREMSQVCLFVCLFVCLRLMKLAGGDYVVTIIIK